MHCIKCGVAVPDGAAFCPSCGAAQQAPHIATNQPRPRTSDRSSPPPPDTAPPFEAPGKKKNALSGCVGAFLLVLFLLFLIGTCVGDPKLNQVSAGETPTDNIVDDRASANTTPPASIIEAPTEETSESGLTAAQMNAVRSARSYLAMTGFSRMGLIEQLSSDAGEGYSLSDATAAVDSLDVDWNDNAARSARKYLEMSGFSCQGLIEQLSSSAGEDYTLEQATFGAREAGAC